MSNLSSLATEDVDVPGDGLGTKCRTVTDKNGTSYLTNVTHEFILGFTRIPLYVLRLRAAYNTLMVAMVVAGIVS